MKSASSMVDILTGLYAASAVLAALRHRDRTGEGQHIDLSLLDCGVASLSHFAMNYLVSGEVPQRRGNGGFGGHPLAGLRVPRPACASSSWSPATTGSSPHCAGRRRPRGGLLQDPRFQPRGGCDLPPRGDPARSAEAIMCCARRTVDEWLDGLDAPTFRPGPVNELPEAFADPQSATRAWWCRPMTPWPVPFQLARQPDPPVRHSRRGLHGTTAAG